MTMDTDAKAARRRITQLTHAAYAPMRAYHRTLASHPHRWPVLAAQRSAEWHCARSGRMGASTGAVPCGIGTHSWAYSLWQKLFARGDDPSLWDFPSTLETRHGTRLEPLACIVYELLSGNTVVETGAWLNDVLLYAHASPDGLVEEATNGGDGDASTPRRGLLEIKCPVYKMYAHVPVDYMAQMQQQMWVLDREWVDFFVYYHDAQHARLWRVWRSRAWERWALGRMRVFASCASAAECRRRLPCLGVEAQQLLDSEWNWRATAAHACSGRHHAFQQMYVVHEREFGGDMERLRVAPYRTVVAAAERFLRRHLPPEPVRVEFRWEARAPVPHNQRSCTDE